MSRGRNAKIGDENVSANGYTYVRTAAGWRLKHHLVAEKKYGRMIDTTKDQVVFLDKDRTNFDAANIEIRAKNIGSDAKRRARILAKIEELQAELEELDA
jgi:hypothetical protein